MMLHAQPKRGYPPILDDQERITANLRGYTPDVYHAYLEREIGPHEAVWHKNGQNIILLCKPTSWTDSNWFYSLVADLAR
jgi:hypothetical protein